MASRIVRVSWTNESVKSSLKVLSVFFAIFLLFNSGFVYEVAKDRPVSIPLNSTIDYPRFNEQEVLGAEWLQEVKSSNKIYADTYRSLLLRSFEWEIVKLLPSDVDKIQRNSYIYLGTLNVVDERAVSRHKEGGLPIIKYGPLGDIINMSSKIYTNNGAEVYYL